MANGPLAAVLQHLRQWVGVQTRASLTDSQLLEQYVRGEDTAFAALVERHASLVYGVCRRMLGQQEDAEDAFQATFLVFARRASSIRRRESLSSWLHGVARRVALKARLQTARRRDLTHRATDGTAEMAGPDSSEQAAQREATRVLDEELRHLPEKYRLPLILCYFQGRTYEEAAEELGLPSGSMGKRLNQAQEQLRQRLLRRGVTLSATGMAALLASSAHAAPPVLTAEATKAALSFAAGTAIATGVSARVVGLAQGVLHSLWLGKVKTMAAALGALALLLGGGSALVLNALVPNPVIEQPRPVQVDDREMAPAWVPNSWQERWVKSWKNDLISVMALAPDGKILGVGKGDGTVALLDPAANKEIGRLGAAQAPANQGLGFPAMGNGAGFPGIGGGGGFGGAVGGGAFPPVPFGGFGGQPILTCMAFAPDGASLVTGNGVGRVEVWDIASRRSRAHFSPGEGSHSVQAVTFAPDGKSLVAGGSVTVDAGDGIAQPSSAGWIKQWDIATGNVLASYTGEVPSSVNSLSFHPNGQQIAFTETAQGMILDRPVNNVAKFLDLRTGKIAWRTLPTDAPLSVVHDPSGKVLALTFADGTVKVWDHAKQAFAGRFKGMNRLNDTGGAAVSPDGRHFATLHTRTASAEGDRGAEVWFWDGPTGKLAHRITFAKDFTPSWLAFSADGSTLAVGGTGVEADEQNNVPPAFAGFGFNPFGPAPVGKVTLLSLQRDVQPGAPAQPLAAPDSPK
jgi:RNA polymerase sigma factor (sigma-70 family)